MSGRQAKRGNKGSVAAVREVFSVALDTQPSTTRPPSSVQIANVGQSTVEAAKLRTVRVPVQAQQQPCTGTVPPQQSTIDAAKWRPPQASRPPPPTRRLDVDVVLRSLKLELRLQTRGRPQSGWQVATPGSIEWTRGFFPLRNDDEICMGDAVCGVNEQARTFTGTQTGARKCEKSKQSSVASAKQLLLTGNASSRPVPRTLAEQTSADSDSAVDLWALPAGERWTCRAICCSLIGMLFQMISRPPFKPAKLLFTLPLIMLGVWQQAMKAPSHCASSLAPHLVLT